MSNQWTESEGVAIRTLRVSGCGGDVEIIGRGGDSEVVVEGDEPIDQYARQSGDTLTISGYPHDLEIKVPTHASVELDGIGGDASVHPASNADRALTRLSAHSIGGDLDVVNVPQIELGTVGGDVDISGVSEEVKLGHIGGDLQAEQVARLSLKAAGGDVAIKHIDTLVSLGQIGGDLDMGLSRIDGEASGTVGGDATLRLADEINLALSAIVGGDFSGRGEGWNQRRGSGRVSLRFGHGENELRLTVGGDLSIKGGQAEQAAGEGRAWSEFEGFDDLRGLGRELEEMGRTLARDLGSLGRDIAREVRVAGREAQREMREEMKHGFGRRPPRVHVRVNEHEFKFDPEQIDRIKRAAREAAAAGIAKAQEAVEQALRQVQQGGPGMHAPHPPRPPRPPRPFTGQTVRIDREPDEATSAVEETPTPAPDRDAQRMAILKMVHEGRLAPEEAEMLLRGLDR